MKLNELIKEAEKFAPNELAEEWDNVGLMVGGGDREIQAACVSLDITENAVHFAIKNNCDLIISHHPFIMPKLNSIDFGTKKGELIEKLIKNNIAVYSMHTNFDSADGGVNDTLCEIFGIENREVCGMLRKGEIAEISLEEFIEKVKKTLGISFVSYCGELEKKIRKVAFCGGGGGSFIPDCFDCDVLLTGEAKYHEFQTAVENNFAVVAAGHFETENITLYKIREFLKNLNIKVKDGDFHQSFQKIM